MLLWTDPPFGTGKTHSAVNGSYRDNADTAPTVDAITSWLPAMAADGTVVVCCDYRLAAEIVIGITQSGWAYRGEIIWEFGLGRPRDSWWPVRHNNLLTFTRTPTSGMFDNSAVPRTRRLSPKPSYPDTKPSGSVWDFTLSNTHPDRVQYPNQKPVQIVEPFILAHTARGDLVVDIYCGSGTTGVAALSNGRRFLGIDSSPHAVATSTARLVTTSSPTQTRHRDEQQRET